MVNSCVKHTVAHLDLASRWSDGSWGWDPCCLARRGPFWARCALEAVTALADEVRRQGMDGSAFDALVASRVMPGLGDAVRPSHMATLRRCWNAKRPAKFTEPGTKLRVKACEKHD